MHDSDNEIVNSQANMKKANQYSLWHEVYETTGYELYSNRWLEYAKNAAYMMQLRCIAQIQKGNYNDAVNNNLND